LKKRKPPPHSAAIPTFAKIAQRWGSLFLYRFDEITNPWFELIFFAVLV
jgi:hypothetical protein